MEKVKIKLCLHDTDTTEEFFMPRKYSLEELISKYKFIFLALHGGAGEDGTIQKMLEGKMSTYFKEKTLLNQIFIKGENNETVGQLLDKSKAKIKEIKRYSI